LLILGLRIAVLHRSVGSRNGWPCPKRLRRL
jgi:hypothetical protein